MAQSSSHDLFAGAGLEVDRVAPKLPEIADWTSSEALAREKEALGFWISGHPLDRYRDELASFATSTAAGLDQVVDGREVTIGGVIAKVNRMTDKRGNLMAFATLEDFSGQTELIIFSDCFEKSSSELQTDRMVLVSGRVSTREGERPKVICSEVLPLEKLTERFNCQLVIKLTRDCADKTIERVLATLEQHRGTIPVLLAARENGSEVYIKSSRYAVAMNFELLDSLKELLGDSAAYLRPYSPKEGQ
jgi:DNA polymerase-3 subunit alpha